MILTRFSRVTFNAAHNYLGLTTEVLRTEKAINDIACHPLPPSFYEGGGLRNLRQRFDGISANDSDSESDYFSYPSSSQNSSRSSLTSDLTTDGSDPSKKRKSSSTLRGNTPRQHVHAGDLLTSANSGVRSTDGLRPTVRSRSSLYTPMPAPAPTNGDASESHGQRISKDEFDLKDEVMACIAKSIGLLQPPLSGEESVEASPAFPPSEPGRSRSGIFGTSFGSLSLLEMGDDASSSVTASSSGGATDGYLSGLDNEVEILFFPAGSLLAKAGERNTGQCGEATSLNICLKVSQGSFMSSKASWTSCCLSPQVRIWTLRKSRPPTRAKFGRPRYTRRHPLSRSMRRPDKPRVHQPRNGRRNLSSL